MIDDWLRDHRDDIIWLAIEIQNLQKAAIHWDPTVELVVAHPDLPLSEPWRLWGLRCVRGDLAVRVQRRA